MSTPQSSIEWVSAEGASAAAEPAHDFSFKFGKLERKFTEQFGRPLRITGGANTPMHEKLHHGQARDVGSKELTEQQRAWLVNYGSQHDLQVADYTDPGNNPNRVKQPHIHIQMKDAHPAPGAGIEWVAGGEATTPKRSGLKDAKISAEATPAPSATPHENLVQKFLHGAQLPASTSEVKQFAKAIANTVGVIGLSSNPVEQASRVGELAGRGEPELIGGIVGTETQDVTDFYDTWKAAGKPTSPQELADLARNSDFGRKAVRMIPIFGRSIAQAGEEYRSGDIAGGTARALGVVAGIAGPHTLGRKGLPAEIGGTEWVAADEIKPRAVGEGSPVAGIKVNADAEAATGAGAAKVGFKPAQSEISQLGEAVKGNVSRGTPSKLTPLAPEPKPPSFVAGLRERGAAAIRNAGDWYRNGAVRPYTNVDDAAMSCKAKTDAMTIDARAFAKGVVKAVPDKARRDAIFRYAAAGGDEATLQQWEAASSGNNKTGYANALKLTDAEKQVANNFTAFFEPLLQQGMDAGVIRTAIEDYVPQVVRRGPSGSKFTTMVDHMRGDVEASLVNPNFRHAKQRVFPNIFEGEQAGFTYNTDFAEVAQRYYTSMGRAIESRKLLAGFNSMKASDGRPVIAIRGIGDPVPRGDTPEALLIKPQITPDDAWDYRPVNNWAFKGWKYATKTEVGTPVFMQGEMVVHPEFATKMARRFEASQLAKVPAVKAALRLQGELKATMFSLAPFHLVTEAEHALGHRIAPISLPALDTGDAAFMEALHGGLQVAGGAGSEMFSEGLAGGGLVSKLPGVGKLNARFAEWLFHDYIPRLKYKTYQHIVERNAGRYGQSLSRQQIVSLSADQANAAYGELNYFKMARSKTFQDLSRLAFTAPDFLEARGRFTGQALKGYGAEQRQALMTLALSNYAGARVINALVNNGDAKWDPKDAFVVYYHGQRFTIRTVPGDIEHFIQDPRGFVAWRVNPFLVLPGIELLAGTDLKGGKEIGHKGYVVKRKMTPGDVAAETGESVIPIPLQGVGKDVLRGRSDDALGDLWRSMLQSVGIVELPREK
jgi:hypothetical protein